MGINEALDNLYVCATNAKSETLEEGYYEKCYDRVIEELNQKDKAEADLYEANKRIADLLLILGDRDRLIDLMLDTLIGLDSDVEIVRKMASINTKEKKEHLLKIYEKRCKNAKD